MPGAGTRSTKPTDVSILIAPDIAPVLACKLVGEFTRGDRRLLGEQQGGQHTSGHALQPVVGQDQRELLGCILMIRVVGHAGSL